MSKQPISRDIIESGLENLSKKQMYYYTHNAKPADIEKFNKIKQEIQSKQSESGLRASRSSLKSVRFKTSQSGYEQSPGLRSKKNDDKKYEPQDLFPDEKNNLKTIEFVEKIVNQELNAIKEEEPSDQNNIKINQFIEQYHQLNQEYKSILKEKYSSTICYPYGGKLKAKPLTLRASEVKPLEIYLSKVPGSSTRNLNKIESKIVFQDQKSSVKTPVQRQISKTFKSKRNSVNNHQQMLDKFNRSRFSFLNSGSFDTTPELASEFESENTFKKRHKSVQPQFQGHVYKNNQTPPQESSKAIMPAKILPTIKQGEEMNRTQFRPKENKRTKFYMYDSGKFPEIQPKKQQNFGRTVQNIGFKNLNEVTTELSGEESPALNQLKYVTSIQQIDNNINTASTTALPQPLHKLDLDSPSPSLSFLNNDNYFTKNVGLNQSRKLLFKSDSNKFGDSYLASGRVLPGFKPNNAKKMPPVNFKEALDEKIKTLAENSPSRYPFKPKLIADPSLKTLQMKKLSHQITVESKLKARDRNAADRIKKGTFDLSLSPKYQGFQGLQSNDMLKTLINQRSKSHIVKIENEDASEEQVQPPEDKKKEKKQKQKTTFEPRKTSQSLKKVQIVEE